MSARTYVVGNFKGGVGKSTTVQMLSFENSQQLGRKTLVIDLDPQGNTSDVLLLTASNFGNDTLGDSFELNMWDVIQGAPVKDATYNILPNLDLIPANIAFSNLPDTLVAKFPDDKLSQFKYVQEILEPLKEEYDDIYIDVPPTISIFSNVAMYFADYVIIILQTQVKSLKGAQTYIDYMKFFMDLYDTNLTVVGVVPFMLKKRDAVDEEIYAAAQEIYGDNLLKQVVLHQGRLKRYDGSGITFEQNKSGSIDMWDLKAHEVFLNILKEIDLHREILESEEG